MGTIWIIGYSLTLGIYHGAAKPWHFGFVAVLSWPYELGIYIKEKLE